MAFQAELPQRGGGRLYGLKVIESYKDSRNGKNKIDPVCAAGGGVLRCQCSPVQAAAEPRRADDDGRASVSRRGARDRAHVPGQPPARGKAVQNGSAVCPRHDRSGHRRPDFPDARHQLWKLVQRLASRQLRDRGNDGDCAAFIQGSRHEAPLGRDRPDHRFQHSAHL